MSSSSVHLRPFVNPNFTKEFLSWTASKLNLPLSELGSSCFVSLSLARSQSSRLFFPLTAKLLNSSRSPSTPAAPSRLHLGYFCIQLRNQICDACRTNSVAHESCQPLMSQTRDSLRTIDNVHRFQWQPNCPTDLQKWRTTMNTAHTDESGIPTFPHKDNPERSYNSLE